MKDFNEHPTRKEILFYAILLFAEIIIVRFLCISEQF